MKTNRKVRSQPDIDQSTPEMAVESLWKLVRYDRMRRVASAKRARQYAIYSARARDKWFSTLEDYVRKEVEEMDQEQRIEKVEMLPRSHAVVYVNEPPNYILESTGPQKKFILRLERDRWVIEDSLRICPRCEGTGLNPFLSNGKSASFSPKDTMCEKCLGKGWENSECQYDLEQLRSDTDSNTRI